MACFKIKNDAPFDTPEVLDLFVISQKFSFFGLNSRILLSLGLEI
jgi:hypothetical protein